MNRRLAALTAFIFIFVPVIFFLNFFIFSADTIEMSYMPARFENERYLLPPGDEDDLADADLQSVADKWNEKNVSPGSWGEHIPGVKNRIDTEENEVALTFDACGGDFGNGYDEELIEFLRKEEVPATLFFNARWIEENEDIFLELAEDPLFSVQNHGTHHLPLSVTGSTAWGIEGTSSVDEVVEEVMENQRIIKELTGENVPFFRSGTAHYDEASVKITEDLGLTVVNYDILGDAGATFTASQVENQLLQVEPGSIALLHMNQPGSGTAEGVMNAVPQLRAQGVTFVQLTESTPLKE